MLEEHAVSVFQVELLKVGKGVGYIEGGKKKGRR
jgi:hypothetical protein